MDFVAIDLPSNHKTVLEHFVAACQSDTRIVAAFLGGSYASGKADGWSDVDLYLITADEAYDDFLDDKEALICQLGEPLYLEDWGTPHCYFFTLADGTEGELGIGRASRFQQIHGGTYTVLVDKQGILDGVQFPLHQADPSEQIDTMRQLMMDFWHEFRHFHKALAREQLWFAIGSLEELRGICVNLARLRYNLIDPDVGDEPYWKLDQAMPVEQLELLGTTFCPLERKAIRQAGQTILEYYREAASALAETHGIAFPAELDQVMTAHIQ